VDTRSLMLSDNGAIRIHLAFDRHFVPAKLGINSDTRELVMFAPAKTELHANSE